MNSRVDSVGRVAPKVAADSVGKGAASIGGGRLVGMIVSFALMLLLTRRSEQDVGVFRTLATFLLIAESLPLLGMQRWLATEMGKHPERRGLHVASAMTWAASASLCTALAYVAIASSGIYDAQVSHGLLWIAFAAVPSGALLVEQSALIGIGSSGKVGLLNLVETVLRSSVGIALVLASANVLVVIAMFALLRWATAAAGFSMLRGLVGVLDWRRPYAELRALRGVVPRFAGAMVCFLALRNAGLVMLPSLADTVQAGRFGVSSQLADLAMLVPTVLALSSTFAMARGAANSRPHLRRAMLAMVLLLTVSLWPLVALGVALAEPLLSLLFGARFVAAAPVLQLMLLATPLMAIDQVLSQGMVSDERYHDDLVSVGAGAVTAVVLTALFVARWGAVGAALAFLIAMGAGVCTRLWLMRDLRLVRVMVLVAWRATLASIAAGLLTAGAAAVFRSADERWALLWTVPGALALALCLGLLGGMSARFRARLLEFIRRKG